MLQYFWHDARSRTRLAALDAMQANVMIADRDMNIVYMNGAVKELLRAAQDDLRKDLPNFDIDRVIGSSIDIFHKDPAHQRRVLADLSGRHDATVRVGKRSFDIRIGALRESETLLGFVVEWADADARLRDVDHAAQLAALNRCQAVVEFDIDGTIRAANENFLTLMGYRLEEVVGRHHSMFVESGAVETEAYRALWRALRGGEYQATRFKRIAKGGRAVWIEGAYTPALDAQGKVAKVVKFATDITGQMTLLADLKHLIDTNFGEIDREINVSSDEARAVAGAAGEALANVEAVAASAEQMAASVHEISEGMARSRTATDAAFDQTVTVGKNTDLLASAAQSMNGVVSLIRDIADQINLLALNATIEAARAGDAGKGFAVVASEVKSLAIQAAHATGQIATEIERVQATSLDVVGALEAIRASVRAVREQIVGSASAVEEQTAVTRSMSQNMQNASGAVSTVSSSVTQISGAIFRVAQAVAKTKDAAKVLAR